MRITRADFICSGNYSISDLKIYFQKMKIKSEREKLMLCEIDKTSDKINASFVEISKSYEALLSGIDRNMHPDLYRVISDGIKKLNNLSNEISSKNNTRR